MGDNVFNTPPPPDVAPAVGDNVLSVAPTLGTGVAGTSVPAGVGLSVVSVCRKEDQTDDKVISSFLSESKKDASNIGSYSLLLQVHRYSFVEYKHHHPNS